jgi:tryptophanyl-tRNA synthetase
MKRGIIMKKALTGLQPTGTITLGNYIGAIKQMVDYQNDFDSYLFVADLHAITIPQDKDELRSKIKSLLALYLACGIDPSKNKIFLQSENIYHTNISWMLECNTYYGELSRMTQFKDKSKKDSNFSAGLLTYPILMAADILAYDIDCVPVGQDQKQHVELARDIAIRFNNKYGQTFVVPEPIIRKEGTKILDLQDPSIKMNKSAISKKGVILMLDEEDVIRKKIMGATTDSLNKVSFDLKEQPGISNLINIYSSLTGISVNDVVLKFKDYNYGDFKKEVADVVVSVLSDIQNKYNSYLNSNELNEILDKGLEFTMKKAKAKYEDMKQKMGLSR